MTNRAYSSINWGLFLLCVFKYNQQTQLRYLSTFKMRTIIHLSSQGLFTSEVWLKTLRPSPQYWKLWWVYVHTLCVIYSWAAVLGTVWMSWGHNISLRWILIKWHNAHSVVLTDLLKAGSRHLHWQNRKKNCHYLLMLISAIVQNTKRFSFLFFGRLFTCLSMVIVMIKKKVKVKKKKKRLIYAI